jgi:type VI secretion system secreted protein VgrG
VGQPWSSRTGIFWTPEIGDEVIVGFEEGDPDRPVILGSVYNPRRMPPQPPQ